MLVFSSLSSLTYCLLLQQATYCTLKKFGGEAGSIFGASFCRSGRHPISHAFSGVIATRWVYQVTNRVHAIGVTVFQRCKQVNDDHCFATERRSKYDLLLECVILYAYYKDCVFLYVPLEWLTCYLNLHYFWKCRFRLACSIFILVPGLKDAHIVTLLVTVAEEGI